jgi:ATP-binding cassette subfamily B protein
LSLTARNEFWQAIKQHPISYSLGVLALIITSITEVLVPKFTQWSIDHLSAKPIPKFFTDASSESMTQICLWLLVTLVVAWAGRIGWRQFLARMTHVAGHKMKVRLWDSLRFQPLAFFSRYSLGDLMNRATGDWRSARFIHGFTIVLTCDMVFFTIFAGFSMLLIDWQLTLYSLAIFPFLPRFIARLAKLEHAQHTTAQEKLSDLSELISSTLGSIRMQRATNSHDMWHRALASEAREYAHLNYQVVKTGWKIFPLGALPTVIAYGVLLLLGLSRIEAGHLTVGGFVALLQYVLLMQVPLFELGDCIAEWQKGFASLSRLVEIFNFKSTQSRGELKKINSVPGDAALSIRNMSFSYGGRVILKNASLEIEKSERVGITGPIGIGKTTFLNILAGLLPVEKGSLSIYGRDVDSIQRKQLTERITLVPQKSFLFAGSIRYNLNLDQEFSDQQLWEVLDLVQLGPDVCSFEDGLETWIGEWGITLSGGQKQRLALARALLRANDILLLDDCLSAVDASTEERILDGMTSKLSGLTIVWIAHRISTLKLCSRILTLEDGGFVNATKNLRKPTKPAKQPECLTT